MTLGETTGSFVARKRGPMPEPSDFLGTIAGSEANVAVALVGLGVPAAYIGRVGADGIGTTADPEAAADAVLRPGPKTVVVRLGPAGALERRDG